MIILKYWREILIALILVGVCFLGWHLKSIIDHNREMAAQIQQNKVTIDKLNQQVKEVDRQRKLDNALTLAQLQQRQQQQTTRKHDDAAFRQAVQSHPQTRAWVDAPLPADALARLSDSPAGADGQTNATSGTPG